MKNNSWQRQRSPSGKALTGCLAVPAVLVLAIVLIIVSAVGTLLGWNIGVVGVAHAVHAHVSNISLWTAIGVGFVVGTLSNIFRNPYQSVVDRLQKKADARP